MAKADAALMEELEGLSEQEKARLPGRLRRLLENDPAVIAWNEAKAERDAALDALMVDERQELTDVDGNPYVVVARVYKDENGPAEAEAIKKAWQARKKELLSNG